MQTPHRGQCQACAKEQGDESEQDLTGAQEGERGHGDGRRLNIEDLLGVRGVDLVWRVPGTGRGARPWPCPAEDTTRQSAFRLLEGKDFQSGSE